MRINIYIDIWNMRQCERYISTSKIAQWILQQQKKKEMKFQQKKKRIVYYKIIRYLWA